MVSIIICSRSQDQLAQVKYNVAATIGAPYEVVAIDNSQGRYSIFQAYNWGIAQSTGDLLCFMHEDISFETQDWGQVVQRAFRENSRLGLLGVAGSSYKPAVPSGWSFDSACDDTTYMNIVQYYKGRSDKNKIYSNPKKQTISNVVSVDGVWFCTTRAIAEKVQFDEKTFSGFHCYDVDFSLAVLQHHEVAVTFEVLINHFSEGSFNDSWITETIKLHDKWRAILPINLEQLPAAAVTREEFKAFHAILPRLVGKKDLCMAVLKEIWKANILSLVGVKKFLVMNLLLAKKSFKG
ncbi:glycosyltransferase family protein [Hymenobacter aerilatus]|uniref:Glycosyltransferase family protein n=1 Tax=Hymenobacter aerilatus TaxID=2932251 RepID=A0A8T9SVY9_9BACT|nr:glycosyltransferase [Hymenobacter aerilatus]UOR03946.1 glycosyltransferase family protein [Hymenobacter aerilatus]